MKIIAAIILIEYLSLSNGLLFAQVDITPPVLVSFTFSPTTVDVSSSSAVITFTAHVTDDISGYPGGSGPILKLSNGQSTGLTTIISGTSNDAIYSGTITIPQYTSPAVLTVIWIFLDDNANNMKYYSTADLQTMGFPTEITVVDSNPDITPPILVSFTFSPTMVDVSSSSAVITFTAHVTDDISGYPGGSGPILKLSNGQSTGLTTIISGTSNDATYSGTITIPQNTAPEVLSVIWIYLSDNTRNTRYYYTTDLQDIGLPTQITVGILPVELISFTATSFNSHVVLNWFTATEVNNYGFEIEKRFINGQLPMGSCQWIKIGFFQGNGTSNAPNEYSFTDQDLSSGRFAYRLKQVDNNGVFKYSQEIEVSIDAPSSFALSQNFPNPFNPTTTFSFDIPSKSFVSLKVFDALGREVATVVSENMSAGSYTKQWNVANISSGIYFYRLQTGLYSEAKKLVLLR